MDYIVDMEGFKQEENECVLKELAILPVSRSDDVRVFLFKPPFPWRRLTQKCKHENLWYKHFYHGLNWKSGKYSYDQIYHILRENLSDASTVFVNGKIRKEWLKRFRLDVAVVDITELGYLNFHPPRTVTVCPNHNGYCKKIVCALHTVKLMEKFFTRLHT